MVEARDGATIPHRVHPVRRLHHAFIPAPTGCCARHGMMLTEAYPWPGSHIAPATFGFEARGEWLDRDFSIEN